MTYTKRYTAHSKRRTHVQETVQDLLVQEARQFSRGGTALVQREEVGAKAHRKLQPGRRLLQCCDHIFHEYNLQVQKKDLKPTSLSYYDEVGLVFLSWKRCLQSVVQTVESLQYLSHVDKTSVAVISRCIASTKHTCHAEMTSHFLGDQLA